MTTAMGSDDSRLMHWSTAHLPAAQRYDYWTNILGESLFPLKIKTDHPAEFAADLVATSLGPLSVLKHTNNGSGSRRTRRDVAGTAEHSYHLLMSVNRSWSITHVGHHRARPGDLVLIDSQIEYELDVHGRHDVMELKIPAAWLDGWLPDAGPLIGQTIDRNSRWGDALKWTVYALSPEKIANDALPASLVAEEVGALLALVLHGTERRAASTRELYSRVHRMIVERCAEPLISAEPIAESLGLTSQTVHQVLAMHAQTFKGELQRARERLLRRARQAPRSTGLS